MSDLLRLSPQLLVAGVSAFVGVLDMARRADPLRWASAMSSVLGVAVGERWDAALLQYCGYWSHFDHRADRSHWPIGAASTAEDFAAFGRARGLLREDPEEGDILLQFTPRRQRFVRAGLVVRVLEHGWWTPKQSYVDVLSIEGDTGRSGALGGANVFRVVRRLSAQSGDRFLRWVEAEPEAAP